MGNTSLKIQNKMPISLPGGGVVNPEIILECINNVNLKFVQLKETSEEMALNVFKALDFRMLSGLVGESLVTEMANKIGTLQKNPNIDGYPDLINASRKKYCQEIENWQRHNLAAFIKYPYGGIEVKNTFGTKKPKTAIAPLEGRVGKINNKLDWKAHHRYTNFLLGLLSDYIDGSPQIVAAMFSRDISEGDWKVKQDPKEGSTMTSFSVIEKSGFLKMKSGLLICIDDDRYLSFFSQGKS